MSNSIVDAISDLIDKVDNQDTNYASLMQQVAELRKQLESKAVELQKVRGECDERAKEKGEAQQAVEELRKQLEVKGVELQGVEAKSLTMRQDLQLSDQAKTVAEKEAELIRIEKSALESVLERVQSSRDHHVVQRNEAVQAVDSLQSKLVELKAEMEQLKLQHQNDLDVSRDKQNHLQAQVEQLKHQLQQTSDAFKAKESAAKNSSEEAEITLLQLHQVQEELETVFLADQEKANQMKASDLQLVEIKQKLEAKGGELQKVMVDRNEAKKLAQKLKEQLDESELFGKQRCDAAELTLIQLHQAQEELEYYFLLSSSKEKMLQECKIQQKRIKNIFAQVLLFN